MDSQTVPPVAQIEAADVAASDLLLIMEPSHLHWMRRRLPRRFRLRRRCGGWCGICPPPLARHLPNELRRWNLLGTSSSRGKKSSIPVQGAGGVRCVHR